MPGFRIIGALLVVALLVWLGWEIRAPVGHHTTPEVLGLGNAFEGNLQLPAEKIKQAFDEARTRMLAVNSWGSRLRIVGDIAGWLSFAATSAITLIVGFYGRNAPATAPAPRAPAHNPGSSSTPAASPPNTDGLPARSVRVIGLLAALAAVLTAFGSLSTAKSQDYFKRADEIQNVIVQHRSQIVDATDANVAQSLLDDLLLKVNQ